MKIGLFFGSFNPIHIGHLVIAEFMATQTDLERVWLVVSPHNPLKEKKSLARDRERLHMARLGIGDNALLKASDVEFGLPKPSFTIDTLAHLKEKSPEHEFALIMGGDNLASLKLWKNWETLLAENDIYVYRRPSFDLGELAQSPRVRLFDAPMMDISSTYVRAQIRAGKSVRYLVPDAVFEYLEGSSFYKGSK